MAGGWGLGAGAGRWDGGIWGSSNWTDTQKPSVSWVPGRASKEMSLQRIR